MSWIYRVTNVVGVVALLFLGYIVALIVSILFLKAVRDTKTGARLSLFLARTTGKDIDDCVDGLKFLLRTFFTFPLPLFVGLFLLFEWLFSKSAPNNSASDSAAAAHEIHHYKNPLTVLRERMILLGTMSRPLRLVLGVAIAQLLATALLLALQSLPNVSSKLITVDTFEGQPVQMPPVVFLFSLFFLVLSWGFVLTGAMQTHWVVRLIALIVFTYVAIKPVSLLRLVVLAVFWGWGLFIWFVDRRRVRDGSAETERAWGGSPVTFVLVFGGLFIYYVLVWLDARQTNSFPVEITNQIFRISFLITPILFLAGADLAEIGEALSHYAAFLVGRMRSAWLLAGMAVLSAGVGVYSFRPSSGYSLQSWLPSILAPVILGALAVGALIWVVRREGVWDWPHLPIPFGTLGVLALLLAGLHITIILTEAGLSYRPIGAPRTISFEVYRHDNQEPRFSVAYPAGWEVKVRNDDLNIAVVVFTNQFNGLSLLITHPPFEGQPSTEDVVRKVLGCSDTDYDCAFESKKEGPGSISELEFKSRSIKGKGHFWVYRDESQQTWIVGGLSPEEHFDDYYYSIFASMWRSWRPDLSAGAPDPLRFSYSERARMATRVVGFGILSPLVGGLGILLIRRRGARGNGLGVAGFFLVAFGVIGTLFLPFFSLTAEIAAHKVPPEPLAGPLLFVALATVLAVLWLLIRRRLKAEGAGLLTPLFALNLGLMFIAGIYSLYGTAIHASHASIKLQAIVLLGVLMWDLFMSGKQITNVDTPAVPRSARVLLYLGYIMLVCTVVLYFTSQAPPKAEAAQTVSHANGIPESPLAASDHNRPEPVFEAEEIVRQGIVWLGLPLLVVGFIFGVSRWGREKGWGTGVANSGSVVETFEDRVRMAFVVFVATVGIAGLISIVRYLLNPSF